jgi:dCTP diphosphatase
MNPVLEPHRDLEALRLEIRAFAEARGWERFHLPKNLAMSVAIEAAELMEPFQWLTADEASCLPDDPVALAHVSQEMADVAIYLIRMADVLGVDLGAAILAKLRVNEGRFPVRPATPAE